MFVCVFFLCLAWRGTESWSFEGLENWVGFGMGRQEMELVRVMNG